MHTYADPTVCPHSTIAPVPVEEVVVDRDRENMRLSLPSASNLRGVPEKSAYLLFYQRV
jgi:hypothetical protein